ncbi:MAG: VWA domain-containing protein [Pyrinomonadaceae bacterium]
MKRFGLFSLLLLLVCLSANSAFAQDVDDDPVSVFEVRLPVTVTDKKNKKQLVPGLTENDFVILEDGVPQQITSFTNGTSNPPVYVGVLMDTSPSTQGKLGFSKQAAKDFLYTVLQLRKDKGAFMTFDHRVELHQDFTDKTDEIDRAVDAVKKSGSQTSLYDAVWQFADQKLRTVPGRRVIVIITDGDDTFSKATLDNAIDIAQRTETTIFGISTKEGFLGSVPGVEMGTIKDKGDKKLERLCEETGGKAFFTGDMIALERSFQRISEELKGQYVITYKPERQVRDGNPRKIEVRFKNKQYQKQYELRTKDEYRAVSDSLR